MSRIGQVQRRSSRNETGVGYNMTSLVGIFLFMCVLVNPVSCKHMGFSKNPSANEGQQNDYNDQMQLDEDDAEFDWQLSTDNVDFYKILNRLNLEDIITSLENASQANDVGDAVQISSTRRKKRSTIFGKDDRKQVTTSVDAEVMPYSASVKISTGCTGTLIGPKHVLTAAHCAYKGTARTTKTKLKVGFLRTSGRMRWRKVRRVYAAREWHKLSKHRDRMRYDYAVLELRRGHKRPYMTPVAYHVARSPNLQFNGFPGDKKPNTMWFSRCDVIREWHGYLINHCDLSGGMSGSGSYLVVNSKKYVVRGLVIAAISLRKGKMVYRFNVVNPLTREKTTSICKWMKAGRDCRSFK